MLSTVSLVDEFREMRKHTLDLVETLEYDDFVVQTAPYVSPPKWHLGHVSWLFEVLLKQADEKYEYYSEEFLRYLNSYYNRFGEQIDKASRGTVSRPTVKQILEYYETITKRITDLIQSDAPSEEDRKRFELGINHEYQHQELLVYDLQHILADQYKPKIKNHPPKKEHVRQGQILVDGGLYNLGYGGKDFCYDIEMPEHKVYLKDFKIDSHPVTAGQYLEFIESGGYSEYKYWLSDGWKAVKQNSWKAPMYWQKIDDAWHVIDFIGMRKINPNEPVCNVSFYESDAYCKWAGKRLPTEAEWEKAACWNEEKKIKTVFPWGNDRPTAEHANLLESHLWCASEIGSYPMGKSHYGCYQMIGDVWEWTSSEFVGYPGFKSGFQEYNDKWFTNQKVLRGGSFATPKRSIRASYRNFFRLDERWMFSGFRCVEDI
ncbi:ergothioneine biosynthesis protein EgtB [Candidatus Nitrosotenuis sp. DW1]|uniref:ergothioneine biosynthesis protein EgtB n=1 Tax=Candidatus Nitrosotenuis sp. DW1 TaxID=2259672 RepID=UPI0015C6ADFC|nr:ergothioneine biosynthesis protein EgtB [Candidatus Nitrosotenuis sp. DW1]QLH09025.1 ergothioneine biosynthesis protein EgtB [Candidatus Nitrosotenuis sp. DW1]